MISRAANELARSVEYGLSIHRHRLIVRRACECAVLLGTTFLLFCLMAAAWTAPLPPNQNSLRIYFVDVEGGQATLFVAPTGRSLFIDTGWPGNDGRDADRIVAAARKAGVSKIDFVLVTHFHSDHVGRAPQLAARIPIGTFIDHGENRENNDAPTVQVWQAYEQLLATQKYKRIIARPGEYVTDSGHGSHSDKF